MAFLIALLSRNLAIVIPLAWALLLALTVLVCQLAARGDGRHGAR